MLRDQIFNVKDQVLLGTSFFHHPLFVVDYSLAHNFKVLRGTHEYVNFILFLDTGDTQLDLKIEEKLRAYGCPFSDTITYATGNLAAYASTFVGISAVYSPTFQLEKESAPSIPFRPIWLVANTPEKKKRILEIMEECTLSTGKKLFT